MSFARFCRLLHGNNLRASSVMMAGATAILLSSCGADPVTPANNNGGGGGGGGPAEGWNWENPLPQGNNLNDVHFASANLGIAVGGYGTIMRTSDGGATWAQIASPTTQPLNGVDMVGVDTGFAVGAASTVLCTQDGGLSWVLMPGPVGLFSIEDVEFVSATLGWIVGSGGTIGKTDDGGLTWQQQTSNTVLQLAAVAFSSTTTGIVVGRDGKLLRTLNSGVDWVAFDSGTFEDLNGIDYVSASTVIVVGDGNTIIRSISAGAGWTQQTTPASIQLLSVDMRADLGVVVGAAGMVARTDDAGITWSAVNLDPPMRLHGAGYADPDNLAIVGVFGFMQTSADRGDSWVRFGSGEVRSYNTVASPSANTTVALGNSGAILRTSDNGRNWSVVASPHPALTMHAIEFISPTAAYAAGNDGCMMRTDDTGATWVGVTSPVDRNISALHFLNATIGYLAGAGTIMKTVDGGATWTSQFSGFTTEQWLDIDFADANNGVVVGTTGRVMWTVDGGATWGVCSSGVTEHFRSVVAIDATTAFAGGDFTLLKTADAGLTWQDIDFGPTFGIEDMRFFSNGQATIVGSGGRISRSDDGGATWVSQASGTDQRLMACAFIDSNRGRVVGLGGTIIHTGNGGE